MSPLVFTAQALGTGRAKKRVRRWALLPLCFPPCCRSEGRVISVTSALEKTCDTRGAA